MQKDFNYNSIYKQGYCDNMNFDELLDLTLREILEKYCTVMSLECGYYYGVFKQEDIEKIFKEFNIEEEYPEAFHVETLIPLEILDAADEVKEYDSLIRIVDNLGISKKE